MVIITKLVDAALSITFLAVQSLTRFRNYLEPVTPDPKAEEQLLMAALFEAPSGGMPFP